MSTGISTPTESSLVGPTGVIQGRIGPSNILGYNRLYIDGQVSGLLALS